MHIIFYHNVLGDEMDDLDPKSTRMHARQFRDEMAHLAHAFHPVSLPALLQALRSGETDAKAVAVTFDDAYVGVRDHAEPVLREFGIPAAIFVVTGYANGGPLRALPSDEIEIALRLTRRTRIALDFLDEGPMELADVIARAVCMKLVKRRLKVVPDERRRQCRALLLERLDVSPEQCVEYARSRSTYRTLDWAALQALAAGGWTIGSHTCSHRALGQLDGHAIRDELETSLADVRAHLGTTEVPFAYPYGEDEHIGPLGAAMVRQAGFTCGLTTNAGSNDSQTDVFLLRRGNGVRSLYETSRAFSRVRSAQ